MQQNKSLKYGLNLNSFKKPVATRIRRASVFEAADEDEVPQSSKNVKNVNRQLGQSSSISKSVQEQHEQVLSEDPTVFAYDEIYDNMKSVSRKKIEEAQGSRNQLKKAKYIDNFLRAAEIRKRDLAHAQERKIQRERETEGDEFDDKEIFVTSAYKIQAEELRKMEEEDRKKEKEQSNKGKYMSSFYRELLDQTNTAKIEAIQASRASIKLPASKNLLPSNKVQEDEKIRDLSYETDKALADMAIASGLKVVLNDDEKIIDKRQLLSAGLNVPKKKLATNSGSYQNYPRSSDNNKYNQHGVKGSLSSSNRQEMDRRERQSRDIEKQILETQRKAEDEQKLKDEKLIQKLARKNDETTISDARARYLARKSKEV
ncbi:hypothetical protein G9A89_013794 [Geosiphon pyriformis]|nr:hypothetical protein G9A89_013794 [Geosiphon pyriformis]